MLRPSSSTRLVAVLLVLAAAALTAGSAGSSHAGTYGSSKWGAKSAPTSLTDANIAAIVVDANTIDIQTARQAETMSKNAKVREFAQQMIKDHTAVNKEATDLAKKLALTPRDNATGHELLSGARSTRARIHAMSGAEFDKAYVDNEVTYHQAVLNMLDKTLIPEARNAELKKLLEDTRPAIAGHLKMAQDLQASMTSTSAK